MKDRDKVLASIEKIPEACRDAWEQVKKVEIPKDYRQIEKVVCCGMGGSSLAAQVIKSLYFDRIMIPFEIVRDYNPPSFVDKKTLVVLLNYSGETEETFSCAHIAYKKRALIFGITTGRKLGQFLKENNIPAFIINPEFNPSGQARLGLPYTIFGLLGILREIGIIKLEEREIRQAMETLKKFDKDSAKKIAQKLFGKIPLIVGAKHLSGSAHVFANQLNETAKNFSTYFILPELNHHLLEGLVKPPTNPQNLTFLFLNSKLYPEEIKKRVRLTIEVARKNKVECLEFKPASDSKFTQVFEALQFSSYISFCLSTLNKVNPAQIPWVNYFKTRMATNT